MKKTLRLVTVTFLTGTLLIACSNNDNNEEPTQNENSSENTNDGSENEDESSGETDESNDEDSDEGSTNGLTEKSDFGSNDDSDEDNQVNMGEGNTEDQLDLIIGDTGSIETSLSTYEVTLDSVEFAKELEGTASQMDTFIIADVTIKNTSDQPLEISDALNIFEISTEAEGGGYGLRSASYEGVDEFEGELDPNQERSGQLLYEDLSGSNHYLKIREGLIEAGGVKNKVTWVFEEE